MKPTVTSTTCLNGKKHKWRYPKLFYIPMKEFQNLGVKWCKRCGSLSEYVYMPTRKYPNIRVKHPNDEYEILRPESVS